MRTKFLSRPGPARPTGLGTAMLAAALMAAMGVGGEVTAAAQTAPSQATPAGARAKKYRATSAIVVDKQNGQRRFPTDQEVDDLVTTLSTFTARPESLPQKSTASGAIGIELGDGYGGVVLAKANEDGTVETRCVFSFEEGAGFLGLVPDVQ